MLPKAAIFFATNTTLPSSTAVLLTFALTSSTVATSCFPTATSPESIFKITSVEFAKDVVSE